MKAKENDFTWLHLSDIHTGMKSQGWLWPTFKKNLYEDLERLHVRLGGWNTVIFSGDLTQRGSTAEFDALSTILSDLWSKFRQWGSDPNLLVLPGNHDLVRPSIKDPAYLLLSRWWDEPAVQDEFWENENSLYRSCVRTAFENYKSWAARLGELGIPVSAFAEGMLPGDASTVITAGNTKVGIVSLNSTWLQLSGDEYNGRLNIDPRQLQSVTEGDPDSWCSKNTFNLLVTHHPVDWLHPQARNLWDSEIDPPGRFNAHLFGHMHEPDTLSVSQAGSRARVRIQAASIFGLEYIDSNRQDRLHGYSVGRFSLDGTTCTRMLWPRRLHKLTHGGAKLGADINFDLNEDNYIAESWTAPYVADSDAAPHTPPIQSAPSEALVPADSTAEVLPKIRYHLPSSKEHLNVRRIEQQSCYEALSEERAVWIVAEWGMEVDGFIWAVQTRLNENTLPVYRLDLHDYSSRESFFDVIRERMECSFERLCEALSNESASYLLLDDVPTGSAPLDGAISVEEDLEALVNIIKEYCPDLRVILRTRRPPQRNRFFLAELKPLDEADTGIYIKESELGGEAVARPEVVAALYRHTDGVPARIDVSLKDLKVVPLAELVHSNPDFTGGLVGTVNASHALIRAVSELATSSDPLLRRSYELLKTLSVFPQGEQLTRIKRFNKTEPFFPPHARELLDRALIESFEIAESDASFFTARARTLVVPRPVREYVLALLGDQELYSLNRRAMRLYFGDNWSAGSAKLSPSYRFDDAMCHASDISNANTVLVRLVRQATSANSKRSIDLALRLSTQYVGFLIDGHHYRGAASICDDLIPLIQDEANEDSRAFLNFQHAKCLRMLSKIALARDILRDIPMARLSKNTKQSALLNLALCYQSLEEEESAVSTAREIIDIDPHAHQSLQAQSIILELSNDDPDRNAKLIALQETCRKQNAIVAANNIALFLAKQMADNPVAAKAALESVIRSGSRRDDFYNKTRASINLAQMALKRGDGVTETDKSRLISAYHFLLNERFNTMFESCHDALWTIFEKERQRGNLLKLFRHSSLIWRLNGKDERETKYLQELAKVMGSIALKGVGKLDKETAYYIIRASAAVILKRLPSLPGS